MSNRELKLDYLTNLSKNNGIIQIKPIY